MRKEQSLFFPVGMTGTIITVIFYTCQFLLIKEDLLNSI